METENLLKENARLRTETAKYQSALEAIEIRAKAAEQMCKELAKKLRRIAALVVEQEA